MRQDSADGERTFAPPGLLALRGRMLAREAAALARAEPLTALMFAGLLALGAAWFVANAETERAARALAAVPAVLTILIHGARRDERLLVLAGRTPRGIFAAEYGALALPFVLLLLTMGRPAYALGVAAAALLLPWTPSGELARRAGRGSERAPWRLPLPARSYEWTAGLRGYGGGLLLLYAVGAAFSRWPGVILFGFIVLAWWASALQVDGEGQALLEAYGKAPAPFLREKVMRSLALFAAACAPLAVLFVARHAALWPALAVALVLAMLVHAGSVFTRYAVHREGGRAGVIGPLTALLLTGALLVPPVGLFLLYRLRRAALATLHARLP